jgi:hypothetical protein
VPLIVKTTFVSGPGSRGHDKTEIELKLNSVAFVRELTIPTERPPLLGEFTANFCGERCRVVSATDSHGR